MDISNAASERTVRRALEHRILRRVEAARSQPFARGPGDTTGRNPYGSRSQRAASRAQCVDELADQPRNPSRVVPRSRASCCCVICSVPSELNGSG